MKELLLSALLMLILSCHGVMAQNPPFENEQVLEYLQDNAFDFLEKIPENQLLKFGIGEISDIGQIDFLSPIGIYTLVDKKLDHANTWRVPLVFEGKVSALFTVYVNANELAIGDFGAVKLVKYLEQENLCSDRKFDGIVRLYNIQTDFLMYSLETEPVFEPIGYSQNRSDVKTYLTLGQLTQLVP
jgi:hypothetical protein